MQIMFAVAVVFSASIAQASAAPSIFFDSENQLRENTIGEKELPWINRFGVGLPIQNLDTTLSVDGQFEADSLRENFSSHLYRASLTFADRDSGMHVEGGRFLLNQSQAVVPLDGLEVKWDRKMWVASRVFGGFRRHLDVSNFANESFVVGGDLSFEPLSVTSISGGYRYENDLNHVSRHWLVGGIKQALPIYWTPVFYGAANYQADQKILGTLEVGAEIHPSDSVGLSGEIDRYNESKDNFEWSDQIFLLFSQGPEWQERGTIYWEVSHELSLSGTYAHQSYNVAAGTGNKGHAEYLTTRWESLAHRISADATLFLQHNYGGTAYGGAGRIQKRIFEKWKVVGTTSLARYDKVTQSKDYALHLGAKCTYEVLKNLEAGVSSEFNSNIRQTSDVRGGVVLSYLWL